MRSRPRRRARAGASASTPIRRYLGNHILTSAQKKVDVGVFSTIALAGTSKWKGGVDSLFNAKNNGVGYGKVTTAAPSRAGLIALLAQWQKRLASGKVKPPRTVK